VQPQKKNKEEEKEKKWYVTNYDYIVHGL